MHTSPSRFGTALFFATSLMLHAGPQPGAVNAVHGYLVANQLDARWQGEPIPLESAELRAAYPDRQFYFTFKAPPPPPGAPMPDVLARHAQAMNEYRKNSLRLTVAVDAAQTVAAMEKAGDFNQGLQPITTDAEARNAAAAILSLINTETARPGVIHASEVTVTRAAEGWTCVVNQQPKGIAGTVVFDSAGKCVSATKQLNYQPPVPS